MTASTCNGPQIEIHQDAFLNAGNQVGTGALARLNTPDSISLSDAHIWLIRGDLTYYKQGWGGGHEFRAGIWAAPSMVRETVTEQVNGGFGLQRDRYIDPSNSALGTTPFYIRTRTPAIAPAISEHDRDIAFYVQDSWTPTQRMTLNAGLRVDFIKRHDEILDIDRQKSTAVQPRVGVSYLITEDARNVVRASYGRLYEQVNGRDYIVTFGQTTGAVDQTETYIDKAGNRNTVFTPATQQRRSRGCCSTRTCTSRTWTSSRSATTGSSPGRSASAWRRRSAASTTTSARSTSTASTRRAPASRSAASAWSIRIAASSRSETNNTWTQVIVNAIEMTFAKNMSNNFQIIASATRQWQHLNGTWNPTDPARFVQPDAFDNNRDLSQQLFGNGDDNTLNGGGRESGAAYRPFSVRIGGQWLAPWGISVGGSYVIQSGGYIGPLISRLEANDPQLAQLRPGDHPARQRH